jgi:hypothetical protein
MSIMKKKEILFGFEMNYDDDGLIEIDGVCTYPQEKPECMQLYNKIELLKIDESKVEFPLRIVQWIETINPIDNKTIMSYFNIKGIKKIVEENKSKLIGKVTFVKPEISYPKKNKFPNLHIHFYQVAEDEGIYIIDEYDMSDTFHIQYENTKQFTKKRIADLEPLVNTLELFQMPFLPMEMVRFDENGNVQDFQQHLYALKSVKLCS